MKLAREKSDSGRLGRLLRLDEFAMRNEQRVNGNEQSYESSNPKSKISTVPTLIKQN
jgi:hypothetical protein